MIISPFIGATRCLFLLLSVCVIMPNLTYGQVVGDFEEKQVFARGTNKLRIDVAQVERRGDPVEGRMTEPAPAGRGERPSDRHDSGSLYIAGFGGYTFGHEIGDPEGFGSIAGVRFNEGIDLANSGVYGAKVGYFLPDRWSWLGLEVEAFNTTPHVKAHSEFFGPGAGGETFSEGSHLRVTTLAFNLIGRLQLACGSRTDSSRVRRVSEGSRDERFCPLQPYLGVGLGVFFARAKDVDGSSSDNAVPGLNVLAGVRYFLTEHMAVFGEYKYNRATIEFDRIDTNLAGVPGGFRGDYSVSMLVGGLSFHF